MRKISKIEPSVPPLKPKKKVAAYARVSMQSERMFNSLSAQISYYSTLIQKNPEWEYVGVYADSFVSGTSTAKREEFKRLIMDCESRKIDIVLCKSISRFARNTVDLLETIRHLKRLGIEVRFEKENINSMSGDGELLMTVLASFAEQESISISENLKWAIQKKFERGEPWGQAAYGYTKVGNDFIINEDEAVFIQKIYADFLDDVPMARTAKWLRENGCPYTTKQFVKSVLTSTTYTGDLLLQQHFSPRVRHMKKNNGEMPMYQVKGHHPSIIPLDVFECEELAVKPDVITSGIDYYDKNCVASALIAKKLIECDNVIITPHIAYNTLESVNKILEITFNNIRDYCKGMRTNQIY